MKQTDYAPRAAFMDTLLTGQHLVGAEVGCDVGAHAEALLRYCSVKKLYLIDLWTKEYYRGYCEGRLHALGFKNNIELIQADASEVKNISPLDFVYIDISHDYATVKLSLTNWWEHLSTKGIMGYRNYSDTNPELKKAVDEFVMLKNICTEYSSYHNEIVLFK